MRLQRFRDVIWLADEGQTSAEYVGISAVAVVIAVTVAWFALKVGLGNAIESIGESIVNFVSTGS